MDNTDTYTTMVEPEEQTFEEHIAGIQAMINDGTIWHFQGSAGREAMDLIKNGYCTVGTERHKDYWGNTVPAQSDLEPGSFGTQEFVDRMTEERS